MRPIIIEGPDGIGKTTAIQRLSFMLWDRHEVKAKIGHLSRGDVEHLRGPNEADRFFQDKLDRCVIWDRFHMGSLVYGRRLKLHDTWMKNEASGDSSFYYVHTGVMRRAVVIILYDGDCVSYSRRLSEVMRTREEMFDLKTCCHANHQFAALAKENGLSHVAHDVNYIGYPIDAQLEYWIELARKEEPEHDDDYFVGDRLGIL